MVGWKIEGRKRKKTWVVLGLTVEIENIWTKSLVLLRFHPTSQREVAGLFLLEDHLEASERRCLCASLLDFVSPVRLQAGDETGHEQAT